MRLTGTFVLVLSVLAFAGSAYAGNGNGNGNNGNGGNSANAPGQVKKEDPPAPQTTTTAAATTTTTQQQTTTTSNSVGVKPSNSTAHDTHAEAQSDKTKQYGNGQTAGQIAEKNGASPKTDLHGPGNSQPHKATPCTGGHERDVHALKGKHSGTCGSTPDPKPTPNPKPNPGPTPPPPPTTTTTTTQTTPSGPKPPSPAEPGPDHGGLGPKSGGEHGVLSTTQGVGHAATLPFTGQALWAVALAGIVLIATGLALRQIRSAEPVVGSRHDHTDRARRHAAGPRPPFGGRPGR